MNNAVLEFKGQWWKPFSNLKLNGILNIIPNQSIRLIIDGDFKVDDKIEIINGTVDYGQEVTLFQCFISKQVSDSWNKSIDENIIDCNYAFIGAHFKDKLEIKFKELYIKYSFLEDWLDINKISIEKNDDGFHIKGSVDYKRRLNITEREKIIFFSYLTSPIKTSQKEIKFTKNSSICIEFEKEEILSKCFEYIKDIRNFLCIAMLNPVYPIFINGAFKRQYKNKIEKDSLLGLIDIYSCIFIKAHLDKEISKNETLFNFSDIEEKIDLVLLNWFKKKEYLKDILDQYYGFIINPDMYLENQFLFLSRLLEAYHRIKPELSNYDLGFVEFDKRKKEVLKIIKNNSVLFKWLNDVFGRYGNIKSFKKRLCELVEINKEILKNMCPETAKKIFIEKVIKTRNILTHPKDPKRKKHEEEYVEYLNPMVNKLEILFIINILKEIGFTNEVITNILTRRSRLKYYFDDKNWQLDSRIIY